MSLPATYSLSEVAETIGRSPYWLAAQARQKKVPHLRVGREVRFTEEDVAEMVASFKVRPAAAPVAVQGMTRRSAARAMRSGRTA